MENTTKVLEDVADESWGLWVGRLIPNVICRVRADMEARAQEEHNWKLQEEAKHVVDEKLVRVVKQDRWLKEKLMAVLEGWLSQAVLEVDLEVEKMEEVKPLGQRRLGRLVGPSHR